MVYCENEKSPKTGDKKNSKWKVVKTQIGMEAPTDQTYMVWITNVD